MLFYSFLVFLLFRFWCYVNQLINALDYYFIIMDFTLFQYKRVLKESFLFHRILFALNFPLLISVSPLLTSICLIHFVLSSFSYSFHVIWFWSHCCKKHAVGCSFLTQSGFLPFTSVVEQNYFYFFLILMSSVLFYRFILNFDSLRLFFDHFTYWYMSFAIYFFVLFIYSNLEGIFFPTLIYIMEFKMFVVLPAFSIPTVINLIRNCRLSL